MALLQATFLVLKDLLQARLMPGPLTIAFYSNNVTPTLDSVFGDFTACVDGVTGLPIKWPLAAADWTYTETVAGCKAVQPQIADIVNGAFTTYGYFIYDGSNVLKWAQRWSGAPIVFSAGAQAVIFTPEINANSPT